MRQMTPLPPFPLTFRLLYEIINMSMSTVSSRALCAGRLDAAAPVLQQKTQHLHLGHPKRVAGEVLLQTKPECPLESRGFRNEAIRLLKKGELHIKREIAINLFRIYHLKVLQIAKP
jgi:hypothetical protein